MTQLTVYLEDSAILPDIKRAIRMLRGVASVRESEPLECPNPTTLKAMEELEQGKTTICSDFNDYLKLVNNDLPD